MGEGLSGWVAENRKSIVNGNPSVESGYLNDPARFSTLRSALAVPLEGANGVLGALTLYRGDKHAFTRDHLRICARCADDLHTERTHLLAALQRGPDGIWRHRTDCVAR